LVILRVFCTLLILLRISLEPAMAAYVLGEVGRGGAIRMRRSF
jgi:hypothetical protein